MLKVFFCKKDRNGHTGKVNKSQHGFEKRHFKELGVCVRTGRSALPPSGTNRVKVNLSATGIGLPPETEVGNLP